MRKSCANFWFCVFSQGRSVWTSQPIKCALTLRVWRGSLANFSFRVLRHLSQQQVIAAGVARGVGTFSDVACFFSRLSVILCSASHEMISGTPGGLDYTEGLKNLGVLSAPIEFVGAVPRDVVRLTAQGQSTSSGLDPLRNVRGCE